MKIRQLFYLHFFLQIAFGVTMQMRADDTTTVASEKLRSPGELSLPIQRYGRVFELEGWLRDVNEMISP